MNWIIQENICDEEGYDLFLQNLKNLGISFSQVKVVPFSDNLIIPEVSPENPVVVWGSTTLGNIAHNKGWKPGTFLTRNFDTRICKEHYGEFYLNSDAEFSTIQDLETDKDYFFIRPLHDTKSFAGHITNLSEFEKWREDLVKISDGYTTIPMNTEVMACSVKDVGSEARFFVVDGKVLSGSTYRIDRRRSDKRLTEESSAWKFAQKMADRWNPSLAYGLDVTFSPELKVIEINCINSCGFYGCNMEPVIRAINTLSEQKLEKFYSEADPYIIPRLIEMQGVT